MTLMHAEDPTHERIWTLDTLVAIRDATVRGVVTADHWRQCLAVQSRFWRLSFENALLVAVQYPGATFVQTYNRWRDPVWGRYVRQGEKAHARTICNAADGRRVLAVYDVSQTEGRPMPLLLLADIAEPLERASRVTAILEMRRRSVDLSDRTVQTALGGPAHVEVIAKHLALYLEAIELHRGAGVPAELELTSSLSIALTALGLAQPGFSFPHAASWSRDDVDLVLRTGYRIKEAAMRLLCVVAPMPHEQLDVLLARLRRRTRPGVAAAPTGPNGIELRGLDMALDEDARPAAAAAMQGARYEERKRWLRKALQ